MPEAPPPAAFLQLGQVCRRRSPPTEAPPGRFFVLLTEGALGQFEKELVVVLQGFRGERLEAVAELLLGALERAFSFFARAAFALEQNATQPGRDGAAQGEADQENDDECEGLRGDVPHYSGEPRLAR